MHKTNVKTMATFGKLWLLSKILNDHFTLYDFYITVNIYFIAFLIILSLE